MENYNFSLFQKKNKCVEKVYKNEEHTISANWIISNNIGIIWQGTTSVYK